MDVRQIISAGVLGLCPAFMLTAGQKDRTDAGKKPNVLVIIVDDLRTELGCYGCEDVLSPNIDELSRRGVRFSNAYCNVPVSGASRASLLTGIRPAPGRFTSFEAYAQQDVPDAVSLPEYFKREGYTTLSFSKVFHNQDDFASAWDVNWRPEGPTWRDYVEEDNINSERGGVVWATECADVRDNAYFDGKTADRVVSELKNLKKSDKPFFMCVGFLKPHLPFNAPKKYWDLYDESSIKLPENYVLPDNSIPRQAFHTWGELRFYQDIPKKGPVSEEHARHLIRGYRACVSYSDAQVGKVLAALHKYGMDDDTVILFFGDHGWSLGEHGEWCKHSTFDIVTNAPLIMCAPGLDGGVVVDEVVEFVDIFPTLCELCGLDTFPQLQGESVVGLAEGKTEDWKNSAVIQWGKGMACTLPGYGYTVWRNDSREVVADVLFDHTTDRAENHNIASQSSSDGTVRKMRAVIDKYSERK